MSEPVDGRVTVALVLPVLDEEPGIGPFLDELRRAASAFRSTRIAEIVVVDDGSTDGTRTTLEGRRDLPGLPPIGLVYRSRPDGTVSAQVAGAGAAGADLMVTMDADGQHPVEVIDRLGAAWSPAVDLVVASRSAPGGSVAWSDRGRARTSGGARWLARRALPPARRLEDPISGCFLTRRAMVAGLPPLPRASKLLLYLLAAYPRSVHREIPYRMQPRRSGRSKVVVPGSGYRRRYLAELWRYRRLFAAARRALRPDVRRRK